VACGKSGSGVTAGHLLMAWITLRVTGEVCPEGGQERRKCKIDHP